MSPNLISVIATLATAGLLTFLYGYLYFRENEKALKLCTVAWALYCLRFVFGIALEVDGFHPVLLVANQSATVLFSVFLFWGSCIWDGKPVSRIVIWGSILCIAWVAVSTLCAMPFVWISLPAFYFVGAVSIWTGVVFLRFPRQRYDIGAPLAGWALIIWGIYKFNFPFLSTVEWFEPWGYFLASLLALATAIGTVLYYFERVRFALIQSENRYRDIAEDMPLFVFRTTADGKVTFVNSAYCNHFGGSSESYLGSPLPSILPKRNLCTLLDESAQLRADSPVITKEFKFAEPGGEHRWERWTIRALFTSSQELTGFQGIGEDISERRRTDEIIELIHAGTAGITGEAFFNELTCRLGELLHVEYAFVGTVGEDRKVETVAIWNDGEFGENFTYSLEDTPCENVVDQTTCIYPADVQQRFPRDVFLQENGIHAYMGTPTRDAAGNVTGILVVMDTKPRGDIASFARVLEVFAARAGSELGRREALSALRERERHLKVLFDEAADAIYVSDLDGNLVEVNPQASKMTGYTEEELLALNVIDVDANIQTLVELSEFFKTVMAGEPVTFETRHRRKDGSVFPVEVRATKLETVNGTKILGIARDIAERLERQIRYEHILKTTMDGFWLLDQTGKLIDANAAAADMLGYSRDELLKLTIRDIDAIETEDDTRRRTVEVKSQGYAQFETKHRRKDGSLFDVEMSVSYLGPEDRTMVAFARDITERKRAAEALYEATTQQIQAVKAANVGLWDWDLSTNKVRYSTEWKAQIGYAEPEIGDDYAEWESRVHPDDLAPTLEIIRQSITQARQDVQVEFRFRHKEGTYRWILARASVVTDESGKPVRMRGSHLDITDRKLAEEALRESQSNISALIENTDSAIWSIDRSFRLIAGNTTFYEGMQLFLGRKVEPGQSVIHSLHQSATADHWQALYERALSGQSFAEELDVEIGEATINIECRFNPIRGVDNEVTGVVLIAQDISQRKRDERERQELEEQYRQAQKMEALGQLTGGVAHDFNNLLQVINGSVDIVVKEVSLDAEARELLDSVAAAGARAANLVSQLLLFSRRKVMRREVLDLNDTVTNLIKLLGRIIGEHIQLEWHPLSGVVTIEGDRGMIEQALTNLCVNARDAMPDGGKLRIATQVVNLDGHPHAAPVDFLPGRYAVLSVADTGCGIEEENLAHIFEPFFTTKAVGKGTGLGLATVYGIVKQHGGFIDVKSRPGTGTTFMLFWPVSEDICDSAEPGAEEPVPSGSETILVAEDEAMVRGVVKRMLEYGGYTVLVASNGREAIDLFTKNSDRIDMVLLDVVMPEMGGYQAFETMQGLRPGLKALFASGYTEDTLHTDFVLQEGISLITKPYTRNQLLRTVRKILDQEL